jgi:hypothetical protein
MPSPDFPGKIELVEPIFQSTEEAFASKSLADEFGDLISGIDLNKKGCVSLLNAETGALRRVEQATKHWWLSKIPFVVISFDGFFVVYEGEAHEFSTLKDAVKAVELHHRRTITERQFERLLKQILKIARHAAIKAAKKACRKEVKRLRGLK